MLHPGHGMPGVFFFYRDLEYCDPNPGVGHPTWRRFEDCEGHLQCPQQVGCSGMVACFSGVGLCQSSMEIDEGISLKFIRPHFSHAIPRST